MMAGKRRPPPGDEVVVGFDAEWVNAARADLPDGDAACNAIVSYQVVVLNTATGRSCASLRTTSNLSIRHRQSLSGLLSAALRNAKARGVITDFPWKITLVGHFTRADFTALRDWPQLKTQVDSVRKTLVTTLKPLKVVVSPYKNRADGRLIKVTLVDTMLLAPARSSLARLGATIGMEKIELPPGAIERMDLLLRDDPELFERYALRDAEVAAHYYMRIRQTLRSKFGVNKCVSTLSAAGVQMLHGMLASLGVDEGEFFGFRRGRGRVLRDECATLWPFAANTYHGGRNEAFWLGPTKPAGLAAAIGDFDLKGAYTTAMTMIRVTVWTANCREDRLERLAVVEEALTFARVRFEFPGDTRFPCLPVRADERGLLFPLQGVSWCTGAELVVAIGMGARIEVEEGFRIEWEENSERPFEEFTKRVNSIRKEAKAKNDELLNQTAKEIGNSLYGKLAQGVEAMRSKHDGGLDGKARGRRAFSSRTGKTETLPPSAVTCPPLASFVTGLVRAALSEALARLPPMATAYSATTDGFLADINIEQVPVDGPVTQAFSAARVRVDGDPAIWELKHEVDAALIVKTRGAYTTRLHGEAPPVLARAGYRLETRIADAWAECQEWEQIYRTRDYETRSLRKVLPSLRDQWLHEVDLVEQLRNVRLNLDADLKRALHLPHERDGLLCANTRPWRALEDFTTARDDFEDWRKSKRRVLRTLTDWRDFETWRAQRGARRLIGGTSKSRRPPLVDALLRALARGLIAPTLSQTEIAALIAGADYPCSVQTVKDAKRRGAVELEAIDRISPEEIAFAETLKFRRPDLEIERLLTPSARSEFLCTMGIAHNFCAAQ